MLSSAACDRRGAFAIDGRSIEPGDHVVVIDAPGRPRHAVQCWRFAFGDTPLPSDVVLRLAPPAMLVGHVLDRAGLPVPQATVRVVARATDVSAVMEGRSDAEGRFAFAGLPMFSRADVLVDAADGGTGTAATWLDADGTSHVVVALVRSRDVEGTVIHRGDRGDAPVAHARIVVVEGSGVNDQWGLAHATVTRAPARITSETFTDAEGRFIACTTEGIVVLAEPGWAFRVLAWGENLVSPIEPRCLRITLADGRPAVGAEAGWAAAPALTTADSDGLALLPDLGLAMMSVRHGELVRNVYPAVRGESHVLLGARRRLTGRVVRDDATSTAARSAMVFAGVDPAFVTATSETGRFVLDVPEEQPSWAVVAATSRGWAGWTSLDGRAAFDVAMRRTGSLAVDANQSLAGGHLYAESEVLPLTRRVGRVARDGLVRLLDVPVGPWSASACGVDGLVASGDVLVGGDEGSPPVPLRVWQPLRVRCVDESGSPIEGVMVSIDVDRAGVPGSDDLTTASDAQGLGALTPEPTSLRGDIVLGNEEARLVDLSFRWAGGVPASRSISPSLTSTTQIVLRRGCSATGYVHDEHGRPVSNALVGPSDDSFAYDFTGADGGFTLLGLTGTASSTYASAPGHRETRVPLKREPCGGIAVEIELHSIPAMRGQLMDATRGPVRGEFVDVVCRRGEYPYKTRYRVSSDEMGYFDFNWSAPDETCTAKPLVDRGEIPFVANAGARPSVIVPRSTVIEGRVISAGRPQAGADVQCWSASLNRSLTTSGVDGSFEVRMPGRRPGPYTCDARVGDLVGRTEGIARVSVERVQVAIEMEPLPGRDVRLVDRNDGLPLPGATAMSHEDWRQERIVHADPTGHVRVLEDDDEYIEMSAWAPGFESGDLDDDVSSKVALERLTIASGRVLEADGRPASAVPVEYAIHGGLMRSVDTAPDGRFDLAVHPGRLGIVAKRTLHGRQQLGGLEVDVPPSGRVDLIVRLARIPTGTVRVRVVDASGPIANDWVELEWKPASAEFGSPEEDYEVFAAEETDADGVATFEGVPPGRARVRRFRDTGMVDVLTSQTSELTLVLRP